MLLSALTVLLCFLMTRGFPTDLKCQGKRKNGLIYYKLSSDIIKQIQDCEVQWLIKEKVMALYDGNMRFELPILNATVNAAIIEDGSEVKYTIDCPKINVHRRLSCSYLAPEYQTTPNPLSGYRPSSEPMKKGGFPGWGIAVTVIIGVVCLLVTVFILVHKRKSRSKYDLAESP